MTVNDEVPVVRVAGSYRAGGDLRASARRLIAAVMGPR